MVKKRGLGKSLDALLAYTETANPNSTENKSSDKLTLLSINQIQRGKYNQDVK